MPTESRGELRDPVIPTPDELEQREETLAVLTDPEALANIREAEAAYREDNVVRGVEAVRAVGALGIEHRRDDYGRR